MFVESTFRERYYQEAFYDLKDIDERPISRIPVFFEGIDAYLSFLGDVRMEYFGHEIAFVSILVPLGGLLGKSF